DKAKEVRQSRLPEKEDTCTMCGDFCAMKKGMEVFKDDIGGDKVAPAGD
ncbi:MAG: phosphomethylpyrimidine synthase ThiC, partial [Deltaproteobacteria bacterium]|nr:phosphomethylpyrimidine synthase ThiC [Deltaproteobacteria bacterium]